MITVAAGDLGAAAARSTTSGMAPVRAAACREVTSSSNYTDYSARRMGTA
ncbi:MAG: hypothetical protein R2710_21235 [Acidimicrobiales bacterium]